MAQIGTVKYSNGSEYVTLPIYDIGDSEYYRVKESCRVETGNGVGFIPISDIENTTTENLKINNDRTYNFVTEVNPSVTIADYENQQKITDTNGWSLGTLAGTGKIFSVQNNTVISGNYSLKHTVSGAGQVNSGDFSYIRNRGSAQESIRFEIRMEDQDGNDFDNYSILAFNEDTRIFNILFNGAGEILWFGSAGENKLGSWSTNTNYDVRIYNIDISNRTATVEINGNVNNVAVDSSSNENLAQIRFAQRNSGSTDNTWYIDNVVANYR